jgi:hypothetical protein
LKVLPALRKRGFTDSVMRQAEIWREEHPDWKDSFIPNADEVTVLRDEVVLYASYTTYSHEMAIVKLVGEGKRLRLVV